MSPVEKLTYALAVAGRVVAFVGVIGAYLIVYEWADNR